MGVIEPRRDRLKDERAAKGIEERGDISEDLGNMHTGSLQ
jgi:hypothetical protein